ncbi:MAG: NAD(P)H-hydrate dehydratase [Muribaculaceae bacterium]|nr:NAD(P)H-hydrate dehydratase [Muribaculaceae bacterium]
MKLFTTEEIRAIERYTIENDGVSALELTERVAEGVANEVASRWRASKPTIVFAGPGNNGADALATSRLLSERGFHPEVYLFNIGGDKLSADCMAQRDRLLREVPEIAFHEVQSSFNMPKISQSHLIIDGLFGSGLCEELKGGFKSLVQYINEVNATVVSIDLPSGLFGDWNPQIVNRNTIHATLTLAIQFPRISFFISDNAELIGEWKLIDIGLSGAAIAGSAVNFCLVESRDVQHRLRQRNEFASKADFGSAVLYAGSYGMMGAAILAARGCLRGGVGKLTVNSPKCGYAVMQTAVPEALYRHNRGELNIVDIHPERSFNAIAIGPGIGTNELTVKALGDFLAATNQPVILDADALNCIALKPSVLNSIPVLSVITPHAGEFDRLFGPQPSAEARLRKAIEMAKYYNILIVLKGRYTAIVRPDGKVYFNSSGCPAMATPGSGDVLTGLLLAMLAQGYPAELASLVAVYIHGVAGEMAAAEHGEYGVTATDIAENIGRAIRDVASK